MNRRLMLLCGVGVLTGVLSWTGNLQSFEQQPGDVCCPQCGNCRAACLACVAACLNESGRAECIRLCLDCADICGTCEAVASRKGPMAKALMAICAEACTKCAAECEKHREDPACKRCAEACRACAKECQQGAKAK
ncbi:MAG: four-helix bundle copper-binding protein [Gemmataceae bacterium]|nr:four-helix bundle copper-binding protein [Gemmataceae bacterium]MDW8264504.1 four-helix bundle copper-binding protein [Gemmataceae bacterium]